MTWAQVTEVAAFVANVTKHHPVLAQFTDGSRARPQLTSFGTVGEPMKPACSSPVATSRIRAV
jgi:hypothetical protein